MDQVKQHSKAKYLPTHTQTHTLTPQWKRGFPPPPPQHRGLSDQRSDLQCLSHRGRRENTQIHMYKPARHTHYITLHTYQMKRLLAELTHQQTVMYFPAEGGREGQQAAEVGRVRRDMRSARSPSLSTLNIQFSSATDKTSMLTAQTCHLKTFSNNMKCVDVFCVYQWICTGVGGDGDVSTI